MATHEPPKPERKILNKVRTADPLSSVGNQQKPEGYSMPVADKRKQAKEINTNDYTPPTQKF